MKTKNAGLKLQVDTFRFANPFHSNILCIQNIIRGNHGLGSGSFFFPWLNELELDGPHAMAHGANETRMDLLTAPLPDANGCLINKKKDKKREVGGPKPKPNRTRKRKIERRDPRFSFLLPCRSLVCAVV